MRFFVRLLILGMQVSVAHGRDLDHITEAETIHSFRGVKEDLQRVSNAVYLLELVDSFSAEQSPSPVEFDLLVDALDRMQNTGNPAQLTRCFEVQLLRHSGFGPELHRCVECRSALEPGDHLFSCARGGLLCPRCRVLSQESMLRISLNGIKVLRFFQGGSYPKAVGLTLSPALLEEIEHLLRTYIRYVLERELKSAEFMNLVASDRLGRAT